MNSRKLQVPCVLTRQLVWTLSRRKRADWRAKTSGASLRELRNKRSVAINFLMCGKVASCVVFQENQNSP